MQELESIGWGPDYAASLESVDPTSDLEAARVTEEHKGRYRVLTRVGACDAEISGRFHYVAAGPEDFPAVGDWVAVALRYEEGAATIHHVLPRRTALVRNTPERVTRAQVLAANLDTVFLVTSANLDFNLRRIERTLSMIYESGAAPVIVLSKSDLRDDLGPLLADAAAAAPGVPVHPVSALTGEGLCELEAYTTAGSTVALIGSSGVGKSTLVNRMLGRELQVTLEIRGDDDKGRHATTHRQLIPLPAGGVLVDTPGIREIGLFEDGGGLGHAFPELEEISIRCRFDDCSHGSEPGCAVRAALEDGTLDPERYASFLKLERELERVRSKRDAQARHRHRQRAKKFAKTLRQRPDKRRPS